MKTMNELIEEEKNSPSCGVFQILPEKGRPTNLD